MAQLYFHPKAGNLLQQNLMAKEVDGSQGIVLSAENEWHTYNNNACFSVYGTVIVVVTSMKTKQSSNELLIQRQTRK